MEKISRLLPVLLVLALLFSCGCTNNEDASAVDVNDSVETSTTTVLEEVPSTTVAVETSATLVIFHSPTCPHCVKEIAWLTDVIEPKYPLLKVEKYVAADNRELYEKMAGEYNTTTSAVPRTFVNGKAFVGFTSADGELEFVDSYKAYSGNANQIELQIRDALGLEADA